MFKPGTYVRFKDGSNAGEAQLVVDPTTLPACEQSLMECGELALAPIGGEYGVCFAWPDQVEEVI